MNLSVQEAENSKLAQGREKVSEQITTRFGFTSDWLKKWCEIFYNQSESVAIQNQMRIICDNWKPSPVYITVINGPF